MTHPQSQPMTEAARIYDAARSRAIADHLNMVSQFMMGEIPIAGPCGMDREREYIIAAFAAALSGESVT